MTFKDEAKINDSMDASMVDAPRDAEEQIDTQASFHEKLGEDTATSEDSEHEHPSM